MHNPPVPVQQDEAPAVPPTATEQIKTQKEEVLLTQKKFEKIKEDLMKAINAMDQNHSLFARAAKYWAEVPLWQKIVWGVGITAPFFIIGIVANVAVLLTISIYTVFFYTASSILLDNHHAETQNNIENLRVGVNSLADLLGEIIQALDKLRAQLTVEINRLQAENDRLSGQLKEFSTQIEQLKDTDQQLKKTNEALDASVKAQIAELESIKALNTLFKTQNAEWMSVVTSNNKGLIEEYNKKLTAFLKDGTKSFEQITTRICDAETRLTETSRQLELRNEEHQKLLAEHNEVINKCTQLAGTLEKLQPALVGQPKYSDLLALRGTFPRRKDLSSVLPAPRLETPPVEITIGMG